MRYGNGRGLCRTISSDDTYVLNYPFPCSAYALTMENASIVELCVNGSTVSNGSTLILCELLGDEKTVRCDGEIFYEELENLIPPSDGFFYMYLVLYIILVLFAGLMSGLTMGLLSLDKMSLEVLKRGGQPRQKIFAKRILLIVKRHHLLLVTLLLANALAVETMPVFLSKITVEVVAIIVSVTAVLFFGEIIPQALCTRFGLAIGYYCSPIVIVLMVVFLPIAFPISLLLDFILGAGHGTFFRRAELKELVKMHGSHENEDPLSFDEVIILKGALDMRYKTVGDAMTPLESVYMLNVTGRLDGVTMKQLLEKGHSRVPVFRESRDDVCGLLIVKKLIQLDPEDCTPIQTIDGAQTPPPSCLTTMPLYELLNHFQTGKSHLSLVYKQGDHDTDLDLVGIITLEDVIEELIGEEIVDETDQFIDVHRRIAVARARLAHIHHSTSAPVGGALKRSGKVKGHQMLMSIRSQSQPESVQSLIPAEPSQETSQGSFQVERSGNSDMINLESIYESAKPPELDDVDESEEAPLIINS